MNVENITVFSPNGPLNKVWLMWEVVKKFYRLSDNAHIAEIAALEKQIDTQFAEGDLSQQTMRNAALLADQKHLADLSGNILIRATVLHLQTAFVEFAVKEVFKLVLPNHTIPRRPDLMRDLINPLKEAGAFADFPPEYLQDVFKHRNAVRNTFAHGDWFKLAKAVQGLDLEKAFVGTGKLMDHFQANLRRLRPNDYYEVKIGEHFPEEQTDPHPKLWRFLVEIPDSVKESHQRKAISVARKAAGTEIMNNPNFKPHASWATFVIVDPAELDFTKCITVDECRVWVLQKPEWV
jgi:hypothetical protein